MASLLDLIDDKVKNNLNQIIIDENNKREKEAFERRKKTAFNNIYDVIDYLKTEGFVGYNGSDFTWDASVGDTPIVWTHQVSDGTDCVFWNEKTHMSIETFKEKFDKGMDEFGFLYGFSKPISYLYLFD